MRVLEDAYYYLRGVFQLFLFFLIVLFLMGQYCFQCCAYYIIVFISGCRRTCKYYFQKFLHTDYRKLQLKINKDTKEIQQLL